MELASVQEAIKIMKMESARLHAECAEPVRFITDSDKREVGCVFEDEEGKKHEMYFFPNDPSKPKRSRKAK